MEKDVGDLLDRTRIIVKIRDGVSSPAIQKVRLLIANFFSKYSMELARKNMKELKIEIKTMNREGSKKEYEVKTDVFCDNVFSSKEVGWNLYQTTKKSLIAIGNQMFQ